MRIGGVKKNVYVNYTNLDYGAVRCNYRGNPFVIFYLSPNQCHGKKDKRGDPKYQPKP